MLSISMLDARTSPSALRPTLHRLGLAAAAVLIGAGSVAAQNSLPTSEALDGLEFRTIGPAIMSGRIVDMAVVESDPTVWYAATSTGGLWKTTTNGVTLTPLFDRESVHSIGDVVIHQRDTNVVWVGTGERASRQSTSWGDGVYKSVDGGETWTHMGLSDSKHIGRIVLHPDDPDIVFVAAMGHLWGPNEERGLYRSEDGGASWERVLYVDEDTGVVDVQIDPADPSIMYASSYQRRRRPWGFHGGGPGSALWTSTDGGSTWSSITNAGLDNGLPTGEMGRIGISIYRTDPNIVYVSVEQGERYNASTAYEQREAGVYRSEDRGQTWTFMSNWNPRPMYASQILVDPSDDQRIYMVNAYSFSDDGGRNFTVPRQSLHGDDRLVWVNPEDSRHVMKADDGGVGISYDRGLTWLYIAHLPVSQYYRVSTDTRDPYWVYGGLQDNGSWAGPNQTYRAEGVLNDDWIKLGGGDGFLNLVDTTDNRTVYTESQYLGLSRIDLITGQRTSIRPGDPEGAIGARRNWTTWPDPSLPDQRLGNAMAPANWDGPFVLSPHDPQTIYAGTNILWKSTNRGERWEALGDHTTGVDRQTLRIMGELPDSMTLSLDDGIPYYPTLSAIDESPVEAGVLYTGTDDGNVHVSRDDGTRWVEVSDRMEGLPGDAWINGIEASSHVAGRVYVTANDYRNNDYGNYVYASEDYGETWTRIDGGVPEGAVTRTLREDHKNPDVLYLGTEFGLFYSNDRGAHWIGVHAGLPTVAVNDLVIQTHDNDLVLGTHGRGIWILDQINALQELDASAMAAPLHVFSMQPAKQIRIRGEKTHAGDMVYRGENPAIGALVDFWLGDSAEEGTMQVTDAAGSRVAEVPLEDLGSGLNRAVWNLRHSTHGCIDVDEDEPHCSRALDKPNGPLVVPGNYTVRIEVGEHSASSSVEVREDPRIEVPMAVRETWTETLLGISRLDRRIEAWNARARRLNSAAQREDEGSVSTAKLVDLTREFGELRSRVRRLYGAAQGVVAPLTADQTSQLLFYSEMADRLEQELRAETR